MKAARLAAALALPALAPAAWAEADQPCKPADLAPVDAWLAKHPWRIGKTSPGTLFVAACQRSAVDGSTVIVAAAYSRGEDEDSRNFIAALVQPRSGKVRSVFTGSIDETDGWNMRRGGLAIDAGPYELAAGVRAFGVDVDAPWKSLRCDDGGSGPTRTLFVQEGRSLRPVLANVELSSWRLVSAPGCGTPGPDDPDYPVREYTTTTIAASPNATNGFADLVLTSTVDDQPAHRTSVVLRYDGSTYRQAGVDPTTPVLMPDERPRGR
jgi:hypothetical protein